MPVYRCPFCPLIFQYRTEAESHVREEHRSRADDEAGLRAEIVMAVAPLDWERLQRLRASRTSPSVTLLLGTVPAATMTVLDIARLRQLSERARRRLPAEPSPDAAASLVEHRLSNAVAAAESMATDRGLAILVNEQDIAIITLPFGPRGREIVGDGFAVRDLEYSLRNFPRVRVLVLGHRPRVLEGLPHQLCEPQDGTPDRSQAAPGRAGTAPDLDALALLAERIDASGMLPLIVMGDHRHLDEFDRCSPYGGHVLAKVVRPRLRRATVQDLAGQAAARVNRDRQILAVSDLRRADEDERVAWGVHAAWDAVRVQRAVRLWVEHDYAVAGRVGSGPSGMEITGDPAEPGVVDDLVDALLTEAAHLGIQVDIVDRGALNHPDPVAAAVSAMVSSEPAGARSPTAAAWPGEPRRQARDRRGFRAPATG